MNHSLLKRYILFIFSIMLVFIVVIPNFATLANDLSSLREQRYDVQADIRRARQYLNDIEALRNTALYEIVQLDVELDYIGDIYLQVSQDLTETTDRLNKAEGLLVLAEERREMQFEALLNRIRFMHENNGITYIELLFSADNFAEFLNNMEHIRQIIEHDNNILATFKETEAAIIAHRDEIATRQTEVYILSNELQIRYAALTELIEQRHTLISAISEEEQGYLELLVILQDADREIQMSIARMEAEASRIAAQNRGPSNAGSANRNHATNTGPMLWPVDGPLGVTSHYGNRPSPFTGRTEFHTGVDLRAAHGTNIVAAEEGVVITSGYMRGFGNVVIIDHGEGVSTLYSHNSRNLVSVGQWVERGEVIARAGATGFATGPHLHFEVRIDGQHIDPRPFLGY